MANDYLVRFSLKLSADNPGDAVDGVVDLFTEKGLRDWVYRVDDPALVGTDEDSLIGFFDGYGDPVDMTELLGVDSSATPVAEPDDAVMDDAELHELAESLNQSNEQAAPTIEEQALEGVREHSAPVPE